MRYVQIYDHEWFKPSRDAPIICCDCGLTHRQELRLNGRFIEMRLTRDNRATAAARRGKGYQMTKVRKAKARKAKVAKAPAVTHEETAAALAALVQHVELEQGGRDLPMVATARALLARINPEEAKRIEALRVGEVPGDARDAGKMPLVPSV